MSKRKRLDGIAMEMGEENMGRKREVEKNTKNKKLCRQKKLFWGSFFYAVDHLSTRKNNTNNK